MFKALDDFRNNVYSQNGEDGVLAEINLRLELLPGPGYWCVEFGAWDGKHLSNTFALVENCGANAVYIEGDSEKFPALLKTASNFPTITPILSFVLGSSDTQDSELPLAFTGTRDSSTQNTLDHILSETEIVEDYDLLSVDIDSFDLEVWESHVAFRPKIVVIEINSNLHPGELQWHGNRAQGNSFSSTLRVAEHKGYTLVCHTGNMVFVRNDLVHKVGLADIDRNFPERLFDRRFLLDSALPVSLLERIFRKIRNLVHS